jgi:hypothetical protein
MDIATHYRATLLEMTTTGIPEASRCFHQARGDRLSGEWRAAVGGRAGDYRYDACCARVEAGQVLGKESRPFPSVLVAGADGAAVAALQLWDQRVWWDDSGAYLEARWRPDTGEQPYSLHGLGRDGCLPREQRVREAIAMLGAIQGLQPVRAPNEEAPGSPYWRLIDPIMDQKRKGWTVDQIAVYLSMNPNTVQKYVGVYDRLHPNEKA